MNEFIIVLSFLVFLYASIKYLDQEKILFIARANMSSTSQSNAITLKGSTDIVAEFFYYGINSILYQVSRRILLLRNQQHSLPLKAVLAVPKKVVKC